MPSFFWGEAVRHSVDILNKLPTRVRAGKTPYEASKGKKPNFEYTKVFGCLSYMKEPSVLTKKLDDRGRAVIHFGREPGTKAYRLYDPKHGTLHISRDVTFKEDKCWTWEEYEKVDALKTLTVVGYPIVEQLEDSEYAPTQHTPGHSIQSRDYDLSGASPEVVSGTRTPTAEPEEDSVSNSESGDSSEPRQFRLLSDIYDDTEEVELMDELMLIGVEEPTSFKQAANEVEWQKAMQVEIDLIERNKTWQLTELPVGHKAI